MEMASNFLGGLRNFWGRLDCDAPCNKGRNNKRIEIVDEYDDVQSELINVQLQPENKRRKVENSVCFKPECVNKISGWLRDDDITTIGIHGMGGVGKTSLAKQLKTRILNYEYPFTGIHSVAWVSLGVNFTVYQLQQEIASVFRLDLHGDKDETRRAAMIYAYLSSNGDCVLFIDELWDDFRREDVGIPRKCKLILISRSLDVCRVMKCEKVLKVEPLSEDESWRLFDRSVGYGGFDSKEIPHIRKCVYDKCAGLPLAITGLAKSLSKMVNDNASSWREVFEDMESFTLGLTHLEDAITMLKLSYERLNDPKLQRCFLYSALHPRGYTISREKLICLWIGVGLIDDVESLQAQYDMGHSIVNKLLNSCLLETCQEEKSVKMHDLVRQMAISIAADDFMVKAGVPSKLEFSENLHVVSLITSSISLIPSCMPLKCTNLSTLLLQNNSLEMIPESLFLNMRSLRVLNLSHTRLTRLPSSIAALEELRVLDLSYCQNLKHVPYLAKLLKLHCLDLSQTAIGQVPCSLEKLKRLKELNLSSIPEDTKIPSKVFLSLFRLKRLSCHVIDNINELQTMNSLEILEARFFSLCAFNNYVRSQHWCILESYHLQVGGELGSKQPYSRSVSLNSCSLTSLGDYIALPSNIQELYLDNCRGFRCLSDVINPVAYHNKKNAQNCASVGQNQQSQGFASLEMCTIRMCHDVETLFAPSWRENLQSLEALKVENCGQLKEVIAEVVMM